MQNIEQWILNIVTLSIFIVVLEILIPSGKTKKFVNIVSGFILIIAIMNPLISILAKGIDINDFEISSQTQINSNEIENNSKLLTQEQNKQIVQEYRKRLISQIEKKTREVSKGQEVSADIIINEDYNSDNFGEIITVYIYLSDTATANEIRPVSIVKEVKITATQSKETKNTSTNINLEKEVDKKMKTNIQQKISSVFEIPSKNIVVGMKR